MKPYSVTMTASQFRYWVTPVLGTAAKADGWNPPVLCAVQFTGVGSHVVAVSTDRFRASAHRHRVQTDDGEDVAVPPFQVVLHRQQIERVLALWRPNQSRRYDPDLTLTFTDDGLTVEGDGTSLTVAYQVGDYPDVRAVFTRSLEAEQVHTPMVALRPEYLAGFGWFKGHARIHISQPSKAVVVQLGDDFLGLVMPVRDEDEATDWATWSPTLQGASK
jgi:hypothetical protein